MKRFSLFRLVLALVIALAVGSLALSAAPRAQVSVTEQDAINTAVAHPVFDAGLAQIDDWSAAAYDTDNAYGIWRVQFWDADGEELAWADVNPARGTVYSYEAHFGASEEQTDAAYDRIRDFINTSPDVLELVEDPSLYDLYVEYDGWSRFWGAYLDIGEDSLYFAVRFDGLTPDSLDNPELLGVYFTNVASYAEWYERMESAAVAVAFRIQEIADALDGKSWTTEIDRADDGGWRVVFWEGDTSLAEVVLDGELQRVVEYRIVG